MKLITKKLSIAGFVSVMSVAMHAQSVTVEAENYIATGGTYNGFNAYAVDGIGAVNFIQTGDWGDYLVNIDEPGIYAVTLYAGTTVNGAAVELTIDGDAYVAQVISNNNWDIFSPVIVAAEVPLAAGEYQFRLLGAGSNGWEWNADKIDFDRTGDIPDESTSDLPSDNENNRADTVVVESENFTLTGGDHKGFEVYSTGSITAVNWVQTGDWGDYDVVINKGGIYSVSMFAGTTVNSAAVELSINSETLYASVPSTGSWDVFKEVQITDSLALAAGTYSFRVLGAGASGWEWNSDRIEFHWLNDLVIDGPDTGDDEDTGDGSETGGDPGNGGDPENGEGSEPGNGSDNGENPGNIPDSGVENALIVLEAEAFTRTGGSHDGFQVFAVNGVGAVNHVQTGDWGDYEFVLTTPGIYNVDFFAGTTVPNAGVELLIDDVSYGSTPVFTGGWNQFEKFNLTEGIELGSGKHTLRIVGAGPNPSGWEWNAERIELIRTDDMLQTLINDAVFKNAVLEACVLEQAEKNAWAFIDDVVSLDCSGRFIDSAVDINQFPNLRRLILADNAIAELDLTANGALEYLDIRNNPLTLLTGVSDKVELFFDGCRSSDGQVISDHDLCFKFAGVVLDKNTSEPLNNVEVKIVEDDITVLTDSSGRFSLVSADAKRKTITVEHRDYMFEELKEQSAGADREITLRKRIKSAATKRWEAYLATDSPILNYTPRPEWAVRFSQQNLYGDFAPNSNITRRDPSAVLLIDGVYHVWYSWGTGDVAGFGSGDPEAKVFPWDKCDVYHATSTDGYTWVEQGPAVIRGARGEFDDRSVFTPEILKHDDRYYLVYQTVKAPYVERVKNTVGMAWSDSPYGPWTKLEKPILEPTNNGTWLGDSDNRFFALKQGDFDSHKVHDPTLLHYKDKFYLYYKGERMGERQYFGQREIKWGVAIADNVFGPYIKHEANPITNTGHELVIWKYKDGIALINTLDGPERGTIQYAADGINFEIMSTASALPHAQGLFRSPVSSDDPLEGVSWGLGHVLVWSKPGGWMYINRFDVIR